MLALRLTIKRRACESKLSHKAPSLFWMFMTKTASSTANKYLARNERERRQALFLDAKQKIGCKLAIDFLIRPSEKKNFFSLQDF